MASSLVNNKYRITRRIGGGSFGEIYMGVGPNNEKVAVKFERHGTRCPQLRHEYKVYRELTNCHGFCNVYHFGTQDNYNVMVMDLLGPSLEDLFNKCSRRFSLKTVLQIADQMLERADTLHSRHLIHRDIKPANFVIGTGENAAHVFCVDFGLSKRYRHPKNLHHIPHRDGRSLTGTPRYASINNHLGIEQSRRDDLESIGYVLVYFLKGTLPWQGLKAKNAQKKYRLIMEKKQQVSIAQLCQGCPSQFAEFLAYTRSLKFDAKPDIPYLRKLFRDLYHAQGCGSIPKLWDWDNMEGNDFLDGASTGGGGNTGGPPLILTSSANPQPNMMSLRPTTAAAVATGINDNNVDNLMNIGNDSEGNDELDEAYGGNIGETIQQGGGGQHLRPQSGGYNRTGVTGNGTNNTSSWGYSRQAAPNNTTTAPNNSTLALIQKGNSGPIMNGIAGMNNDYGTEGISNGQQQRRPHTANGAARAVGFPNPNPQQQQNIGGYTNSEKQAVLYNNHDGGGDEDADGHIVAGARGMMRYRRNRASTIEAGNNNPQQQQQQQLLPSNVGYGANTAAANSNNNAPWTTMYQQQANNNSNTNMKPTPVSAVTSGLIGLPNNRINNSNGAGSNNNWGGGYGGNTANDRPRSANFTGTNQNNSSGGGIMASLTGVGRPSSLIQQNIVPTNWGMQQQQQQQQQIGMSVNNNVNTLSYGSLKNRFLSGASKNNTSAVATTSNNSANGSKVSSGKLFSR